MKNDVMEGRDKAPKGAVWVCSACGKTSRTQMPTNVTSNGWDESCMLHAVLCDEKTLEFKDNRVIKADSYKPLWNRK